MVVFFLKKNKQDLEFIITNKITHIINCSGKQIANHWLSLGINYLTYNWLDIDSQVKLQIFFIYFLKKNKNNKGYFRRER